MYLYKIVAVCTLLAGCLRVVASPLVIGRASEVGLARGGPSELHHRDNDGPAEESEPWYELVEIGWFIGVFGEYTFEQHAVVVKISGKDDYYFSSHNGLVSHVANPARPDTAVGPTWLSQKARFSMPFDVNKEQSALQSHTKLNSSLRYNFWVTEVIELWYRRSKLSEEAFQPIISQLRKELVSRRRRT